MMKRLHVGGVKKKKERANNVHLVMIRMDPIALTGLACVAVVHHRGKKNVVVDVVVKKATIIMTVMVTSVREREKFLVS